LDRLGRQGRQDLLDQLDNFISFFPPAMGSLDQCQEDEKKQRKNSGNQMLVGYKACRPGS